MSTWTAHTCPAQFAWVLVRDGAEVAMVSYLPDHLEHPDLFIGAVVHGLNHPPPLEGWGGAALEMVEEHRRRGRSP